MKSLTTEAMAMVLPGPLVTSWPVSRSSTATVMSAPDLAASDVAWSARAWSPSNAAIWFGGAAGVLSTGAFGSIVRFGLSGLVCGEP